MDRDQLLDEITRLRGIMRDCAYTLERCPDETAQSIGGRLRLVAQGSQRRTAQAYMGRVTQAWQDGADRMSEACRRATEKMREAQR